MARLNRRLRPVELDFLDAAPVRLVFSAAIAAPPRAAYHALAEDTAGWSEWFGAVRSARPTENGRHVVLSGGLRFDETVLAAESPRRYAYRGDATNRPGVRAVLEEWRVEPLARGSLVQWTIAVEPAAPAAVFLRAFTPVLRASFRRAMHRLDLRSV
ncbi:MULTISPECIES: SRPBCC family protein [unclassified Streptomyces]|uniref:SRPBCC family protein n=1 Tax=unclassified Streptomyces TaxID=2593676 RepID=UPI002E2E89BB|nr:SRPBCC family protein [Streptomyces sp. NBC_00223]